MPAVPFLRSLARHGYETIFGYAEGQQAIKNVARSVEMGIFT